MSLKNKAAISAAIILLVLLGSYFLFRRAHPHYVPVARPEVELTIIPGWNLRQVAEYLALKRLATSTEAVYALTGEPATVDPKQLPNKKVSGSGPASVWWDTSMGGIWQDKPAYVSFEGYLAPETVRVYANDSLKNILQKFLSLRNEQFTPDMRQAPESQFRSVHEILTMASIIEKEVKHDADRAIVADILWRRVKKGWALQVDSSVHYAVDKTGDIFTTDKERAIDSWWNTYKYPGLPPGPICNPGLASIQAALHPESNTYWYFLSGSDGVMRYAKTLEEHNRNKKYL